MSFFGCELSGDNIYMSATKLRLHDFPAFALEVLPNRNSLIYGDLYGIENEALTIFRGTLRYEGTTMCFWFSQVVYFGMPCGFHK